MNAEYLEGTRAAQNDIALGNVGDPEYAARNPYSREGSQRTVDWKNGYDTTITASKKKAEAA